MRPRMVASQSAETDEAMVKPVGAQQGYKAEPTAEPLKPNQLMIGRAVVFASLEDLAALQRDLPDVEQ